jgi:hypothetical protein
VADGPGGSPGTLVDSFTITPANLASFEIDTVGSEEVLGTVANYILRVKKTIATPFSWGSGARIYVGAFHNNQTNFVWNAPYGEVYPAGTPSSGRSLEMPGGVWGENRGKDSLDVGVGLVGDPLLVATNPFVKAKSISIDQNVPNPASDKTSIGINLPKSGKVSIQLRDALGREVLSKEFNGKKGIQSLEINIANLKPQVYFYTVKHESGSATKKLIVK